MDVRTSCYDARTFFAYLETVGWKPVEQIRANSTEECHLRMESRAMNAYFNKSLKFSSYYHRLKRSTLEQSSSSVLCHAAFR